MKGTYTMRIAVTYDNGLVFQHFGHTESFKLYDVEDGKIINEEVVQPTETDTVHWQAFFLHKKLIP